MCAKHRYNFFHIYHDRYQNHCTVVTFQCKLLLRLKFQPLGEKKPTRECWEISIVFPLTFFYVKRSEISARSKMAEALDINPRQLCCGSQLWVMERYKVG